jgi:hypothetical protein
VQAEAKAYPHSREVDMRRGPDFSTKTTEILAKRAVQCCSNPECQKKTSGPHSDPGKAVNIGQAAHIRGARPGSARYDPNMTDEQRRDPSNGIWLCVGCATEIDKGEKKFPPKELYIWNEIHEEKVEERKRSYDVHGREELQRLQRENEELKRKSEELQRENVEIRQQLKAKDDWENRKKQYHLVITDGGATVWKFSGNPEHYACTGCFEEERIQILQDQHTMAGNFKCPSCKTDFLIKPMKISQRVLTRSRNPWSQTNV